MLFCSDNQTGASRQVLDTLMEANQGLTHSYGEDEWTTRAEESLRRVFECDLQAYFVATGTAANCLALSCLTQPWETVLCHSVSHLVMDESTAPEFYTAGARLVPIAAGAGKLSAEHVLDYLRDVGTDSPHNPQAGAVSVTQASEIGLVYSPEELSAISRICRSHGQKLHMDGARFANALAALGCTPAELSWKSGVDVLSLGATKCGALCAEAVIFFDTALSKNLEHQRKRSGHLVSKGRLFGAQFTGWLRDDHWLDLARHANSQASQLAEALGTMEGVRIVWPVETNQIFVTLPTSLTESLRKAGAEFYEWYPASLPADFELKENESLVRLVTSFQTRDEDRAEFIRHLRASAESGPSQFGSP